MKVLDDQQVLQALKWSDVIGALEGAFRLRAQSPQVFGMPERLMMPAPAGGTFLTMPCADARGWFGVKQVSVLPENASRDLPTVQAWYTLFGPEGAPVLACSATMLTRLRTAAASALAASFLAPENPESLLVIGTGALAPWMALAHLQVRPYTEVMVWGRDIAKAEATAAAILERAAAGVEVRSIEDLEGAIDVAEVITVATTAREPLVRGELLREGQHLDLVGAFTATMREADAEAVKRAAVFVDDLPACKAEAGDLIQAELEGWSFSQVKGDLAALVSGTAARSRPEEITLFKSVGLALEDLVVARLLV